MAKRFTETDKWKDRWFLSLTPAHKIAWGFICDQCDHAGVVEIVDHIANIQIGCEVDWDEFVELAGDRIHKIEEGKFWVKAFCDFQYGKLNPENRVHKSVIDKLEKMGLTSPLQGAMEGAKDKDKDKDKDKEKKSECPKSDEIIAEECEGSDDVREVVTDWVTYKAERSDRYKPRGLKALCTAMKSHAAEHGVASLRSRVERAMSNGWAGWDFPERGGGQEPKGPKPKAVTTMESFRGRRKAAG